MKRTRTIHARTAAQMRARKMAGAAFGGYQPNLPRQYGLLGKGDGTVLVTNAPTLNYVRLQGAVVKILNVATPAIDNLPVMVGYLPEDPDTLQVLGIDPRVAQDAITQTTVDGEISYPTTKAHRESHRWMGVEGGNDVVFVELRQFMPFRPSIKDDYGMVLTVERGIIPLSAGGWLKVNAADIDFTSEIPATSGMAKFCLVYVTAAGAYAYVNGVEKAFGTLEEPDIPAIPSTAEVVICAVRVYEGQTTLAEGRLDTDVVDLRFPFWNKSAMQQAAVVTNSPPTTAALNDVFGDPSTVGPSNAIATSDGDAYLVVSDGTNWHLQYLGKADLAVSVSDDLTPGELVQMDLASINRTDSVALGEIVTVELTSINLAEGIAVGETVSVVIS